jgi:hypothetical protein
MAAVHGGRVIVVQYALCLCLLSYWVKSGGSRMARTTSFQCVLLASQWLFNSSFGEGVLTIHRPAKKRGRSRRPALAGVDVRDDVGVVGDGDRGVAMRRSEEWERGSRTSNTNLHVSPFSPPDGPG